MDYSVEVKTAKVYKFRKGSNWADITIEEWKGGGSFKCISSYGNFSYIWTSIGSWTLREFLRSLHYDYFMGKAHEGSHFGDRFSIDNSVDQIVRQILESRKSGDIDADTARIYYDIARELYQSDGERGYYDSIFDSELDKFFGNDPTSIPRRSEPDPQCQAFWNNVWQDMCEFWKSELQNEAA